MRKTYGKSVIFLLVCLTGILLSSGAYAAKLLEDFGAEYGLWTYDNSNGWIQINSADPGEMAVFDNDGDGHDEAAVVFPGYGLHVWHQTEG